MMIGVSAEGVANIISVVALLVAGFAIFMQQRAGGRLTALEQERHDLALTDRQSANVSVRLLHYKNRVAWELEIANAGPSSARDIELSARALKAPNQDFRLTNEENLPIAVLQTSGRIALPAVRPEVGAPYEVTISWLDDRPGRQQETHTIASEQGIDTPEWKG
jgi:hypothetical protein